MVPLADVLNIARKSMLCCRAVFYRLETRSVAALQVSGRALGIQGVRQCIRWKADGLVWCRLVAVSDDLISCLLRARCDL
jgi:hypothetical protein